MKQSIHQLVHGYQKGHSLLASSCSLPKAALEVVAEQSDLSGPLPAGVSIPPHLTAYRVPGTEFYAIGRTWPDNDAPRSGCVITHTLLIPIEAWGTASYPAAYLQLHKRPEKETLDEFRGGLHIPNSNAEYTELGWLTAVEADEFVGKVFSEGLRSVIWFDCEAPDQLVMSLAGLLWPSLRASLYVHTFSLHSQAKVRSDLQLHFSPRSAQSHFSRVPQQCHMSRRPTAKRGEVEHAWIHELSEDLRSGHPRDSYLDELSRYGHLLGTEPTAVRNLFFLRDLADRQSQTPTAAVGILDIIDSLEPASDNAVKEKELALKAAVEAALKASTPSSLHCLSLIDARLRRPSFSLAGDEARSALKNSVEQIVAKEPFTLISACGPNSPSEDSFFWQGVTKGMRSAAETRPDTLETLGQNPHLASFIVRQEPGVARAYLHATQNRRSESIGEVVQWVRLIESDDQRHRMRQELLPEALDDASVPLLEELLRDISESDVSALLDTLAESTRGFGRDSVCRVVTDFICQRFPEEMISWSQRSHHVQSGHVAEVAAEAFPLSPEGLERVLAVAWMTADDRCEVWSAFIERAGEKQIPQWFVRRASEDLAVIEPFATSGTLSARAIRALQVIGEQCDYIPIVRSTLFHAFMRRIDETDMVEAFALKAVDSAIVEHVSGRIDDDRMVEALGLKACERHSEQVSEGHLHAMLVATHDREAWQRAWTTLSRLPRVLFRKAAGRQLIADFIRSFRAYWTEGVAGAWARVISRAHEELSYEAALRLHIESTAFCLNNPRLPVSQVVSTAFPYVYEAVSTSKAPQVTDEMFGYFDWDKAKKLRKDAIDTFLGSSWPAEDLAFLASRCQILRKVIHRLQRKWGGDEYIRRMMQGLQRHGSLEAASIGAEVSAIVNDPDFFEPWD